MKISNFIISDENLRRDGNYTVPMSGEVYIPIGTSIPVILIGTGCIGIGVVESLLMKKNSTEVTFDFTKEISKDAQKAYYNLYRNQTSSEDHSDPYENTDAVIPGAMAMSRKDKKRDNNHESNRRVRSLSESLGDDFTW